MSSTNSAVDEFVDCVIDLLSTVELVDDTWMVDASWLDVHYYMPVNCYAQTPLV